MLDDPNTDPEVVEDGAPNPNALGVGCVELEGMLLVDAGAPKGEGVEDEPPPKLKENEGLFCCVVLLATGAAAVEFVDGAPPNKNDDFGASAPVAILD